MESRLVVAWDLGGHGGSWKGYRVSLWRDENILKLTVIMAEQLCKDTKGH